MIEWQKMYSAKNTCTPFIKISNKLSLLVGTNFLKISCVYLFFYSCEVNPCHNLTTSYFVLIVTRMLGCITSSFPDDLFRNPGDEHLLKRNLAIYLLPSHESRSIPRHSLLLSCYSVRPSLSPFSGPFYPSLSS